MLKDSFWKKNSNVPEYERNEPYLIPLAHLFRAFIKNTRKYSLYKMYFKVFVKLQKIKKGKGASKLKISKKYILLKNSTHYSLRKWGVKFHFPVVPKGMIEPVESISLILSERGSRVCISLTRFSGRHLEVSGRRISDVNGRKTRYTNPAS